MASPTGSAAAAVVSSSAVYAESIIWQSVPSYVGRPAHVRLSVSDAFATFPAHGCADADGAKTASKSVPTTSESPAIPFLRIRLPSPRWTRARHTSRRDESPAARVDSSPHATGHNDRRR